MRKLRERRNQKRYKVGNHVCVMARPYADSVGNLVDISLGGVSYRYIDNGNDSNQIAEIDIFLSGTGFCLCRVPSHTISDVELKNIIHFSAKRLRRRSVAFKDLTPVQESMIKHLIENHAAHRADCSLIDSNVEEESLPLGKT